MRKPVFKVQRAVNLPLDVVGHPHDHVAACTQARFTWELLIVQDTAEHFKVIPLVDTPLSTNIL